MFSSVTPCIYCMLSPHFPTCVVLHLHETCQNCKLLILAEVLTEVSIWFHLCTQSYKTINVSLDPWWSLKSNQIMQKSGHVHKLPWHLNKVVLLVMHGDGLYCVWRRPALNSGYIKCENNRFVSCCTTSEDFSNSWLASGNIGWKTPTLGPISVHL